MGKNQHVVRHPDGWAVRSEKSDRPSSVHGRQSDAIEAGRQIAINQRSELMIHGRDGKIRDRNTYGHDPYPPKG
jgi:uncharacterized protein YdaT